MTVTYENLVFTFKIILPPIEEHLHRENVPLLRMGDIGKNGSCFSW